MDTRKEGLPFSGDECWDAFIDASIQELLVPWRELIAENASERDKDWLCAFPVVAYAIIRSRVDGEKSPRWPFDFLYNLTPELASELFKRVTSCFQSPPKIWELERLISDRRER